LCFKGDLSPFSGGILTNPAILGIIIIDVFGQISFVK
jgi:hypothetical protein